MSLYEFGPFQLDADRLLLLLAGEPVALGPKVVETLLALVEHPHEVLTKGALLDRIWPEGYVDEANLAQNVYVLRKTLRAHWNGEAIETIPRRGYRFTGDVVYRDAVALAEPLRETVIPITPAAKPVAARLRAALPRWYVVATAVVAIVAFTGTMAVAWFAPHARAATARAPLSADGARYYEIGRYYWNMRTPEAIAKSLDYFGRVVDSDPNDARGYAALASANAIMGDYEYGSAPPRVYFARARAYAQKALAIDPAFGEAYAVLGMVSSETKTGSAAQMTRAIVDLKRAIELDPASAPAHEWYGVALFTSGRFGEAYAELRKAADLDPLSVATTAWLGNAAYLERRYDDAISYANETLDLSPKRSEAYHTLGLAYEALGDEARAETALRRFAGSCKECKAEAAALLAQVYARTNRLGEAHEQLAYAQAHSNCVDPGDLAVALASVGERSVALSWLRRKHDDYLTAEIASDPRFAVFRTESQLVSMRKPA
jgi:DNA-binding winged helix-turn-helix (wHTH) protein/tetratricopeptide (TPR) repeat protein